MAVTHGPHWLAETLMTGLIETTTSTPPPASCMEVAVWYACRENENGERRGTRDVVVDVRAASNGGVPSAPPGRFLSYLSRNRKPGPLLPPKVIQSARCVCVCA